MRNVGIIGIGPRGGYALERLIIELAKENALTDIHIALFGTTGNFGNGAIYDLDQNPSNWINITERILELDQRKAINTKTLYIESLPSYNFDDIISLRMDKDGNLKWARNINKRQTGLSNSFYTSIPVGEDSYFFINCSDKIKKLSANRIAFRQTNAKKSNLFMVKINKDGDFDYKKLIDNKESKVYYKVNNGNVNNQTVILIGKRKNKTRILKLKI
ncbi:hypothetical protein ES677_06680 [Bizionia gelidisalsuginis]|uniref:FAD-dependent urate hydroxylase HpyO/Asp monooxygenase CreE-like FAD/NAD(P)-binding domain-containing protein n=1 Tax=Bizionia gelidisalsuginis TaxID=291188 RepID=A0ABY3MBP7_9FLAO|nr:FAD/NAD(P)-binding protein [Bizionia gelidisalsuginis]TYC14219.1 hypothetical protein ES677_06680 [Bizionia gelidisalsuginis]